MTEKSSLSRARSAAPKNTEKKSVLQDKKTVNLILKETREAQEYSVEYCAENLRIRRVHLQAIEDGNYKELPTVAHGIGFIRSYAEFLALPTDKIVEQYRRESRALSGQTQLSFPVPLNDQNTPGWKIIVGCIAALLLTVGIWNWVSSHSLPAATIEKPETDNNFSGSADEAAAPVNAPINPLETVEAAPAIPPAPTPPQPKGANYGDAVSGRVELYAEQDSWLQIRDASNVPVFSKVLHAGDTYRVPEQNGLQLTVGNAGGLKIKLDGKELPSLGNNGQILKGIALDPDALMNRQ